MHQTIVSSLALLLLSWVQSTYATPSPFELLPLLAEEHEYRYPQSNPNPVHGPAEEKDATKLRPDGTWPPKPDAAGGGPSRRSYKSFNLKPKRSIKFERKEEPHGDGFVRASLKKSHLNVTIAAANETTSTRNGTQPPITSNGTTLFFNDSSPMHLSKIKLTNATTATAVRREVFNVTGPAGAYVTPTPVNTPPKWDWARLKEYIYNQTPLSYLIELFIGTPPQRAYLILDMGTVWLWVNPDCAYSYDPTLCKTLGSYDPKASNTSGLVKDTFYYGYEDGTSAQGPMYADTLSVGFYSMPRYQFGVANHSEGQISGAMGVAFSDNYVTVVTELWSLGYLYAPMYSLGVGNDGENLGEIIFGGVNHFKYSGQLTPVPVWPSFEEQSTPDHIVGWYQYIVNVTSVGTQMPGSNVAIAQVLFELPFRIDSGYTLSYAPSPVVGRIGGLLNASRTVDNYVVVDCGLRKQSGYVNFGFNNNTMKVDISWKDFIIPGYRGHPEVCLLGIQASDLLNNGTMVLGDTFMRGAYMTFDPVFESVWMATYYSCGDAVVAVGRNVGDTEMVIGQCT